MTSFSDAVAACARQAALEQRARLLDAVWNDVRGEGRSVRHGALPAPLMAPGVSSGATIGFYAADLSWCADGVWRVARDHVGQHPGAGLLEAPVLAAFLPCLCRLLLGETLRLASLPVWWLGEPPRWPASAADRRRLFIRDALDPASKPMTLAALTAGERQWLQTLVDANPGGFIAGLTLGTASPTQRVSYDTGRGVAERYC